MCCCDCCCKFTPKCLAITILVFIFIVFELSFDNVFYRLGSTERYKKALIYLDEKEKGIHSFPEDCYKEAFYYYSIYINHCQKDDENYNRQAEEIRYASLYKGWKSTDLALNIIRILITFAGFGFLLFILLKIFNVFKEPNNVSNTEKYLNIFFVTALILGFVIFIYTSIYLSERINVNYANNDIGLYKANDLTDNWSSTLIAGSLFDIFIMMSSLLSFFFSIILKIVMIRNTNQQQGNGPTIIRITGAPQNYNQNINVHSTSPQAQAEMTSPAINQAQVGQSEERNIEYKP